MTGATGVATSGITGDQARRSARQLPPGPWRILWAAGQIAVLYAILQTYTVLRRSFFQQPASEAFDNALDLIRWQGWIGHNFELDLQRWALQHDWLIDVVNGYYRNFKPVLYVCAVLACLFAPVGYRFVRRAFVSVTLLAAPWYALFPLSPPRFMDPYGYPFVDTLNALSTTPNATTGFNAANQFAAMPSMHMGWTSMAALFLAVTFRRYHVGAIIGLLHLSMMAYVVMVTGNHFVFDIYSGLILAGTALAIAWWLPDRLPWTAAFNRLLSALARLTRLRGLEPAPIPEGSPASRHRVRRQTG
ncbi:MAG TPA: phosphatase PAP2 family protein [Thermomicrobiales bacterium]|nr:phosphatase PAP2 family protein [Thermomicrobiales bacterium]